MEAKHLDMMALLPRFAGGPNLEEWLLSFEEKALMLGVKATYNQEETAAGKCLDKALLLRVGLEGEAARLVRSLPLTATFAEIIQGLKKEFSLQKTQVYAKLIGKRFKSGESVTAYINDVQDLVKGLGDPTKDNVSKEMLVKFQLLYGLPNHLYQSIRVGDVDNLSLDKLKDKLKRADGNKWRLEGARRALRGKVGTV